MAYHVAGDCEEFRAVAAAAVGDLCLYAFFISGTKKEVAGISVCTAI